MSILSGVYFGTMDVLTQEHYNTAQAHFGTRIFWHMDVSANVHFGTVQSNIDISAQTFQHGCSGSFIVIILSFEQCHVLYPMNCTP